MLAMMFASFGQRTRYVQRYSTHALSVPEHDGYKFQWGIKYGYNFENEIRVDSTGNVTQNIYWDRLTDYHISVMPILDSVGCFGEPIILIVKVVEYLSLHAMDDIYYTTLNTPVLANVGDNDFDETDAHIFYNPTPISSPNNGTLELLPDGSFTYTPNPGFIGVDQFVYEAFNDHVIPMYQNATVTIVVQDDTRVADLHIEKTGPAKALFGGEMKYKILVTNFGPDRADSVVVVDTMAFGLFKPTYSIGGAFKPWKGKLKLGNMAAGDSVIVYLFADISPNAPNFIYNEALTWSDTYDPNPDDNYSIWKTELSSIYVDLPGFYYLPSCETTIISGNTNSKFDIVKYQWTPATGLSNPNAAEPIFTPDVNTIGLSTQYVLTITDNRGNVSSDTTLIVVAPAPVAMITGDTLYKNIGENITVYGNQSFGDSLSFFWYDNQEGQGIVSMLDRDSIVIDTTGWFYLRVTDAPGCEALDSVLVLLQSHPPETLPDKVAIVAGTSVVLPNFGADYLALADTPKQQLKYHNALPDSVINVLANDYDRNDFALVLSGVITPPKHSTFTYDEFGNITIMPNKGFWGIDSLQYEVCNKGIPERCSFEWVYIHSLREPLNADVVIKKTGDAIAFWGDTVHFNLKVYSNGPDTTTLTTVTDVLDVGYYNPQYSINNGETWAQWPDKGFKYATPIRPGQDTLSIDIRAFVRLTAKPEIVNMAYIESGIIENELANDTSRIVTRIKELVYANAGRDTIIGSCINGVILDGSKSTGEGLRYSWSPTTNLLTPNAVTTQFVTPTTAGKYTYTLTVTDNDGITASDQVVVTVLPAPVANAGDDKFLVEGELVALDASKSKGIIKSYKWTTSNGNIRPGTESSVTAVVDALGTYTLTVTDSAGCTSTDQVEVYRFYYSPFAIPDYYSTTIGKSISGNVLDNDYEPNGIFDLKVDVKASSVKSFFGGDVIINADGSFTFTPNGGQIVDRFTYWVYNDAVPSGRSRGYVQVTVNQKIELANLHITKHALVDSTIIGYEGGVEFRVDIENLGPDKATKVVVTDSLSPYLTDYVYRIGDTGGFKPWTGAYEFPDVLLKDDKKSVFFKATALSNAPKRIFNAATVTSPIFDHKFDWDSIFVRNVDTASVGITSDLLAIAELIENHDLGPGSLDAIIGPCDASSVLSAKKSISSAKIDKYEWSPRELLNSPDAMETTFKHAVFDTTIIFTLTVISGQNVKTADVTVNFSPQVIANAGGNRKKNPGVPLVLDASKSQGANAKYAWYNGAVPYTYFENGNTLHPIITEPGTYILIVTDMHGCNDIDEVVIKENDLFAVNDFAVMVVNDTLYANVLTNDFDPDGDSIHSPLLITAPLNGRLLNNPSSKIANNGSFIYVPNPNFVGTDVFTYQISDNNNPDMTKTAIVNIRVIDIEVPNTKPVANPDFFFVNKGNDLFTNVMANDYDPDGGTISLTNIVKSPTKGTLTADVDGSIAYIPYETASGSDHFIYKICDNGNPSACDTARVTIHIYKIEAENQHPVASDDAFYAVGKPITGNVLLNDFDPNGDEFALNIDPIIEAQHGEFRFINREGDFSYTPEPGYEGTDQIVYQICETRTKELYCNMATIYITNISPSRYSTDVSITKTGPDYVISGAEVEYELNIRVEGPSLANDIAIIDTLNSQLTYYEYSFDREDWLRWETSTVIDQMMLYQDTTVYIRAFVPALYSGPLVNTAHVDHAMDEMKPINNTSVFTTVVYQKLIANAGSDQTIGACNNPFMLDGTASFGVSDMTYAWYPANLLDNPTSATPMYTTVPDSEQQFMMVISSNINGRIDFDTAYVTIYVDVEVIAYAGEDVWPETGDPITLRSSGSEGAGPLTYLWWINDKEGNKVMIDTTQSIIIDRSDDYYLTVTDKYGCESTDMVHVGYAVDDFFAIDDYITTWQQEPVDIYVLRNDSIDKNDQFNLDVFYVLDYPAHGQIIANPYDSTFTYIPDPYYFGPDSFTYVISTLFGNGQATVHIQVLEKKPEMPEGFSPNGDGRNDFLLIANIELYEKNRLIVFNRWGNIVYERNKYSNDEPWDGVANKGIRIGNGALPTGVYFWILDLGDNRINPRVLKGSFYIASDNRR